jgi:hypothetical protein
MADIRTVIAVTGEDDRFAPIREAALQRARDERATLILYDIDAETSPLESPVPTGWSAEGTDDDVGDRLGPEELAAAGREAIARQVTDAREKGVDAWGWLPSKSDRDTLVEYASREPGAIIVGPADDPDLELKDLPEAVLVASQARTADNA